MYFSNLIYFLCVKLRFCLLKKYQCKFYDMHKVFEIPLYVFVHIKLDVNFYIIPLREYFFVQFHKEQFLNIKRFQQSSCES